VSWNAAHHVELKSGIRADLRTWVASGPHNLGRLAADLLGSQAQASVAATVPRGARVSRAGSAPCSAAGPTCSSRCASWRRPIRRWCAAVRSTWPSPTSRARSPPAWRAVRSPRSWFCPRAASSRGFEPPTSRSRKRRRQRRRQCERFASKREDWGQGRAGSPAVPVIHRRFEEFYYAATTQPMCLHAS
jgi:hypothetical protein